MRRILTIIALLELFALLLVFFVYGNGVETDEAKYLLNIPYPHPPLVRFLLGSLKYFLFQEATVRLIFATIAVQSVWLVWDIGAILATSKRIALAAGWLLTSALLLQGGTVMLAPLTAVFGLVFVWLSLMPVPPPKQTAPFIALFWLLSLFSAYQSILFFPLVWTALRRSGVSGKILPAYFLVPILLLGIYSFSNPLVAETMLKLGGQDSVLPLSTRLRNIAWIWLVAGSGVGSLLGTWGLLIGGRRDFLLTGLVLVVYVFITSQRYYAILFMPLLVFGLFTLLTRRRILPAVFIPVQTVATLVLFLLLRTPANPSVARQVMTVLKAQNINGIILINGYFGHEWQYESPGPIRRLSIDLKSSVEEQAQAIVCTSFSCEEQVDTEKWIRLGNLPVEVWVRR